MRTIKELAAEAARLDSGTHDNFPAFVRDMAAALNDLHELGRLSDVDAPPDPVALTWLSVLRCQIGAGCLVRFANVDWHKVDAELERLAANPD